MNDTSLHGCQVSSHSWVAQKCTGLMRDALSQQTLAFSRARTGRGWEVYELAGAWATQAEADRPYRVLPIFEVGSDLWLGALLCFEHRGGCCYLHDISLIIFRGEASGDKTPLLRAEWDAYQNGDGGHAQPHWHVYSQIESPASQWINDAVEPETIEFGSEASGGKPEKTWADRMHSFHFAMNSQWHRDGSSACNEPMTQDGLLNWLDGCIRYTLRELEYVISG